MSAGNFRVTSKVPFSIYKVRVPSKVPLSIYKVRVPSKVSALILIMILLGVSRTVRDHVLSVVVLYPAPHTVAVSVPQVGVQLR